MLGLPRATIDEACAAPVLITLAGDLREELPVLFLRLREAVTGGDTELLEIAPAPTALSRSAAATCAIRPGDAPPVAAALTGDAAAAAALGTHPEGAARRRRASSTSARAVLAAHPDGEGVVVVAGRPSYAESGEVAAEAAARAGRRAAQGDLPAGAAPGQRVRRPRHGPGPGHPARAGSASTPAASASPPPGARSRPPPGSTTAGHPRLHGGRGRADGGSGGARPLVLLGADPLDDFPDRAVAGQGARRPATSWWP